MITVIQAPVRNETAQAGTKEWLEASKDQDLVMVAYAGSIQVEPSSDFEFPFVPQGRVGVIATEGHFPGLEWEY